MTATDPRIRDQIRGEIKRHRQREQFTGHVSDVDPLTVRLGNGVDVHASHRVAGVRLEVGDLVGVQYTGEAYLVHDVLVAADDAATTATLEVDTYAPGSVGTAALVDAAITAAKLDDASVTAAKLAVDSVDTAAIVDAAVATAKLDDLAVTTDKIALLAVDTAQIAAAAVETAKIADAAIERAKIAAAAVGTAQIETAAITTALIDAAAITTAKIGDLAVTNAKINDVSADRLTAGAIAVGEQITSDNYVAGSSGWAVDGDGNAEFNDVTVRGDVVSTTITSSSITNQDSYNNGTNDVLFRAQMSGGLYKTSIEVDGGAESQSLRMFADYQFALNDGSGSRETVGILRAKDVANAPDIRFFDSSNVIWVTLPRSGGRFVVDTDDIWLCADDDLDIEATSVNFRQTAVLPSQGTTFLSVTNPSGTNAHLQAGGQLALHSGGSSGITLDTDSGGNIIIQGQGSGADVTITADDNVTVSAAAIATLAGQSFVLLDTDGSIDIRKYAGAGTTFGRVEQITADRVRFRGVNQQADSSMDCNGVTGDVCVRSVNGTGTAFRAMRASAFTVSSDRKWKRDVRPAPEAARAALRAVRAVQYEDVDTGQTRIGLVANDLPDDTRHDSLGGMIPDPTWEPPVLEDGTPDPDAVPPMVPDPTAGAAYDLSAVLALALDEIAELRGRVDEIAPPAGPRGR